LTLPCGVLFCNCDGLIYGKFPDNSAEIFPSAIVRLRIFQYGAGRMDSILVTPETLAQYKRDCAADRRALKSLSPPKTIPDVKHDRFMLGKTVFVPKELIGHRFTSEELHAIAF
jgi:hypothetical protein